MLCPLLLPWPGSCVASGAELPKEEPMEWTVPLPRAATCTMESTHCLVPYVWSHIVLSHPKDCFPLGTQDPWEATCESHMFIFHILQISLSEAQIRKEFFQTHMWVSDRSVTRVTWL